MGGGRGRGLTRWGGGRGPSPWRQNGRGKHWRFLATGTDPALRTDHCPLPALPDASCPRSKACSTCEQTGAHSAEPQCKQGKGRQRDAPLGCSAWQSLYFTSFIAFAILCAIVNQTNALHNTTQLALRNAHPTAQKRKTRTLPIRTKAPSAARPDPLGQLSGGQAGHCAYLRPCSNWDAKMPAQAKHPIMSHPCRCHLHLGSEAT